MSRQCNNCYSTPAKNYKGEDCAICGSKLPKDSSSRVDGAIKLLKKVDPTGVTIPALGIGFLFIGFGLRVWPEAKFTSAKSPSAIQETSIAGIDEAVQSYSLKQISQQSVRQKNDQDFIALPKEGDERSQLILKRHQKARELSQKVIQEVTKEAEQNASSVNPLDNIKAELKVLEHCATVAEKLGLGVSEISECSSLLKTMEKQEND